MAKKNTATGTTGKAEGPKTAGSRKASSGKATDRTKTATKTSSEPGKSATRTKPSYWLFKSEPDKFSWDDLKAKGKKGEEWDGVRNYQARNNMREMQLGDLGFFYHSNAGKDIVGIVEVCALAHPDSTTDDERWECVDIRAVSDVKTPVTLAEVKATPSLSEMALVTSMRLSVQPVRPEEWRILCKMLGVNPKSPGR